MATIRCDNCNGPIDVSERRIGEKVACPACGDVNIVRAAGEVSGGNPAQSAAAPASGSASSGSGEQVVLIVRRAMFRARPFQYSLLVLGILAGIAGIIVPLIMVVTAPLAIIGGCLAIACTGALLVWRVSTMRDELRITSRRTIQRVGLLHKRTSEVLHAHIRNVTIDQTFWGRVLGVGTITISSSADEGDEISMSDVPQPGRVRETIDKYRGL